MFYMAILYPEYEIIKKLFTKPEPGEMFLIDYLKDNLSDEYEVFFQSSIAGKFPDVIILHKGHGMMIIEVKDWDLNSYAYNHDMSGKWMVKTSTGTYPKPLSPLEQVSYYKKLFYNDYSTRLNFECANNSKCFDIIISAVFFYNVHSFSTLQRDEIFKKNYVHVFGRRDLKEIFRKLTSYASYFGEKTSIYFSDTLYDDIKCVLLPSKISAEKIRMREKLRLDAKQSLYATSPNKKELLKYVNGYKRKIRGFPGSGKTITLVNRAVNIINKHHIPVLIIVFNITMVNKIHDLLTIFCKDSLKRRQIEAVYYHRFILNYSSKYNVSIQQGEDEFDIWLTSFPKKYPAILIDECQDLHKSWVDCIHNLLQDYGEMLIAADERQHIYAIENWDNEDTNKIYTGIGGKWPSNFNLIYPYARKMQHLSVLFKNNYLNANDEQPVLYSGNADSSVFHYIYKKQLEPEKIFSFIKRCIRLYNVNVNDVSVIGFDIALLRLLDAEFQKNNDAVARVFESQDEFERLQSLYWMDRDALEMKLRSLRRTYRYNFFNESGKIKISTIHSFKGWRTKFIILILDDSLENGYDECDSFGIDKNDNIVYKSKTIDRDKVLYTAITRAETSLIIINIGCDRYHGFFSTLDCVDELPGELKKLIQ